MLAAFPVKIPACQRIGGTGIGIFRGPGIHLAVGVPVLCAVGNPVVVHLAATVGAEHKAGKRVRFTQAVGAPNGLAAPLGRFPCFRGQRWQGGCSQKSPNPLAGRARSACLCRCGS